MVHYRCLWSPGSMEDPHPAQFTLVVMDHCVGVAKVEQILIKVDPTMVTFHVSFQENLLEELAAARLDAALKEAAVVPGDPTRAILSSRDVHQPWEILTVEASLLLLEVALLLVEERFC